jgi:hypothetical protein
METIESLDTLTQPQLETVGSENVSDKGIEFSVDSLPFSIQNSPLSEFRSGIMHIKGNKLLIDGRNTVPEYLRAKLYTIGSTLFLPGLALAYSLIEQVSWIPTQFVLTDDQIIHTL